jgi:hypothetical protein
MTLERNWRTAACVALFSLSMTTGCNPDDLVGEGELPPGAADPKDTQTPAGALRAYRAGLIAYRWAYGGPYYSLITTSALMTDELVSMDNFMPPDDYFDRRLIPEFSDERSEQGLTYGYANYITLYKNLQAARARTRVAAWLIRNFGADSSKVLAAHLDASEGYAVLHLAENFCSGVPLSTVDPDGYTLEPGSTTVETFERAIALFDTALATAGDSTRFTNFARMGKARALLGLGRYAEAAQLAAQVPDGFEYRLLFDSTVTGSNGDQSHDAANFMYGMNSFGASSPGMGDNEGVNGIDWLSSGDPRSEAAVYTSDYAGNPRYVPRRYSPTGDSPLVVAGWQEAQLIQAEAELAAGGSGWLDRLNALRAGAVFPPPLNDPEGDPQTLEPLADPGDPAARVDLLFRERAMWLHLSGQRLADYRRLVRQYDRDPASVYPRGSYHKGGTYGSDLTMPMPAAEREYNRLFTGCINRGA